MYITYATLMDTSDQTWQEFGLLISRLEKNKNSK